MTEQQGLRDALLEVIEVLRKTIEHTGNSDRSLYDLQENIAMRVLAMDGVIKAHADEMEIHHKAIVQLQQRVDIMLEMLATMPRANYRDEAN